MSNENTQIPKMQVGQYEGVPVDQIPTSYCRWILGQKFPHDIMLAAKKKVEASPFCNESMSVSRHALDRFSLRFLSRWQNVEVEDGIATFLAKQAEEAWEKGKDISKNRHQNDGIVKKHDGIRFVFNQSEQFPEYRELITVM